jgi:hypothetical protein
MSTTQVTYNHELITTKYPAELIFPFLSFFSLSRRTPAVSLRVQSCNVRKLAKKRNMLGKRSDVSSEICGDANFIFGFITFRSRNNSRHSAHGARQRQTRSRRNPPRVSHVKIVITRQALGGRRISRIDMPPQAESIEMFVYRIARKPFTFSAPTKWHHEVNSTYSIS